MTETLTYYQRRLMGAMLAMSYSAERFDALKAEVSRKYGQPTSTISGGFAWKGSKIAIAVLTDSKNGEVHANYYYLPIYMEQRAANGGIFGAL